jgi:hypothetical protein
VPEPPPVARSISEKGREGKSKRAASLEEPSPAMRECLKIETACTLCNMSYLLVLHTTIETPREVEKF